MTIDEELNLLESTLRRLKIEYEVFFNNPQKKPPSDVEWKVLALLRKFSDGSRMSFSQRYRFNEMAQRYAIYSDLWRKRIEEHEPEHKVYGLSHVKTSDDQPFAVQCSEPSAETDKVEKLYAALTDAKKKNGENASGTLDSFKTFVQKKTQEIRKQHKCEKVEYVVEVQDGRVKLRAKAKV